MVAQGPQIDPRLPDRPKHPDFWALVQAVGAVDDEFDASDDIEKILTPIVDPECLFYMAEGRTTNVAAKLHSHGMPMTPPAVWLDGFLAGAQYRAAKDQQVLAAAESQVIDVEPSTVSDELIEDEPECASAC